MRKTNTMAGIALLALACLGTTAGGQPIDGSVDVVRGRARFAWAARTGKARHSLKLTLMVGPRGLSDSHDPEQHTLRAVLDGTVLFDVAPGANGYRFGKHGRWRYRGTHPGGRVKIKADGLIGELRITLSRASLPHLRNSSARNLPLTLEMAGTELETTASFAVRDRRVRRWTGLGSGGVPDPGPGPDPDPIPGGNPQQVSFSVLRRGADSMLFPKQHQVARNQSEWASLWQKHRRTGGTPPAIDFSRDMVVAVFLGIPTRTSNPGFTTTIRVVSIHDTSSRRDVVWEEVPNGMVWTCPPPGVGAPCILPDPYEFVLAPKSSLPVVFRAK